MVVVIAKTFIFSLEKKRKRRKERKRKGREKKEKKEGRDWCIQKTINVLLFGWCGPLTLKLFAHIWIFARICAFQTYGFIVVSHWLSMCWLILANMDEELLKQEDMYDTAKDTLNILLHGFVL